MKSLIPYILILVAVTVASLCSCTVVTPTMMATNADMDGVDFEFGKHFHAAKVNHSTVTAKIADTGKGVFNSWALFKGLDRTLNSRDTETVTAAGTQRAADASKAANAAAKEANRHAESMAKLVPEEVQLAPP